MKEYQRDITKLQRLFLSFISIQRVYLLEFNLILSFSHNSKLTLTPTNSPSCLPSAISFINHLLSFHISEQQITLNKLNSEFQYFKGLSHPYINSVKQKFHTIIIPSFYWKELEWISIKKQHIMYVVAPTSKDVEGFMGEYRKINWANELPNFGRPDILEKRKVNPQKLALLLLAGLLNSQVQEPEISRQLLDGYFSMESEFEVETKQVTEQAWDEIRQSKELMTKHIFHEIQVAEKLNKLMKYSVPRRQIIFYLRKKSQSSLSDQLSKSNIFFNISQKERCIIVGNKATNHVIKAEFISKAKSFFTQKGIKYQYLPDHNLIILFYTSQLNLNMQIHQIFEHLSSQGKLKYKYKLDVNKKKCLDRYYYKSKMDVLASDYKFQWDTEPFFDQNSLLISNCPNSIKQVEKKVEELISSMVLTRYVFSSLSESNLAEMQKSKLSSKLSKLKENVHRAEKDPNKYIVEGIVTDEKDRQELIDDLNEILEIYNIQMSNVACQKITFKESRLELIENEIGDVEDISKIDIKSDTHTSMTFDFDPQDLSPEQSARKLSQSLESLEF